MRYKTDDREALLRKWRPFLRTVARSVCRSPQDVEDATQEAELAFLVVYPKFPGGNIQGWIARTVKCSLYSWFAQQKKQRYMEVLVEDFNHLEGSTGDETSAMIDRMLHQEWIGRLSEPFGEAVTLCIVEGLQQTRAAKVAKIKTNTMKSRLDRGTKRLRELVAEDLGKEHDGPDRK